jgi:hypothetical protein
VEGTKGNAARTLSNGHGLPWHSRNLDAFGTREQHGWSRVNDSQAVSVVRNLHQNDVPPYRQLVEQTQPSHAALPGGVSTNTAVSIDAAVSMIEIEQEDWVEEVLDDSMVGMLNIQFDNLIADEDSDLSCL